MTPSQFRTSYAATAAEVHRGTGLDAYVLLAQWADETAWGAVVVGNNLGNIRCSPTSFCRYATLGDFAAAAVATWHNGYYGPVLATAGAAPLLQIAAIGASPWDAGHYNSGAGPGSALVPYYEEITMGTVGALDQAWLTEAKAVLDSFFGVGGTNTTPATSLAQLVADIKAISSPPPATVDLAPVLNALAAQKLELDSIAADVAALKMRIEKDLAP